MAAQLRGHSILEAQIGDALERVEPLGTVLFRMPIQERSNASDFPLLFAIRGSGPSGRTNHQVIFDADSGGGWQPK